MARLWATSFSCFWIPAPAGTTCAGWRLGNGTASSTVSRYVVPEPSGARCPGPRRSGATLSSCARSSSHFWIPASAGMTCQGWSLVTAPSHKHCPEMSSRNRAERGIRDPEKKWRDAFTAGSFLPVSAGRSITSEAPFMLDFRFALLDPCFRRDDVPRLELSDSTIS
jgi:hypothetical protein